VLRPKGDGLVADCRLIGRRRLPNQPEPQATTHFTGRVRLAREPLAFDTGTPPVIPANSMVKAEDIYQVYFHGPAYRVLERAWWDGRSMVGQMAESLPVHHHPSEQPLVVAPRVIELCFQTAGLWEMVAHSRMGLPHRVDRIQVWAAPERARGPLFAVVTPDDGAFNAEVVDTTGMRIAQITGYRTMQHPDPIDAGPLKALALEAVHA
jgi:hypothetical protein